MKLDTSPAPIATLRQGANSTVARFPRRYAGKDSFRVTLRPLLDPWDAGEPTGYLVQEDQTPNRVSHSPAVLQWTASAVAQLQPDALLAFMLAPETVTSAEFAGVADSLPKDRVFVILEHGRVGRRQGLLHAARKSARQLGVSIAVTGNRVATLDGFDGLVVSPKTAAYGVKSNGALRIIATDIGTAEDLDWARQIGAAYVERPELAKPMQMAPIVMPTETPTEARPGSEESVRAVPGLPALAAAD